MSNNKSELTQQTILEAFKMFDLDNSQTQKQLNVLSEQNEKQKVSRVKIVTVDNTFEPHIGEENA